MRNEISGRKKKEKRKKRKRKEEGEGKGEKEEDDHFGHVSILSLKKNANFLDASSHLNMRVCPSVGRSVSDAFVKNGKIDEF